MFLPMDKAILVLRLLVEGNSIRSTEQTTGVEKNSLLRLIFLTMRNANTSCNVKIKNFPVSDVAS
jgi:hypothetical protein